MKNKQFKIASEDIKVLVPSSIAGIAADTITVLGEKVAYMYREEPIADYDSGWRFFSGSEDQDYVDNEDNLSFYKLNTIANYDPAIIPYLDAPIGSYLEKDKVANIFYLVEDKH